MSDKTIKHDTGKPPLSIIPREALEHEAKAFGYGANKYGKNNFKVGGIEHSRLIDAALRHLYAFASGEDLDPESGLNHLGHCRANLAMLLYNIENKKGTDDR